MKKKYLIIVTLLGCLLMTGCSSNKSEKVDSPENDVVETTTEEVTTEDEQEVLEYEGIKLFYDSMLNFNEIVKNKSYTSLAATVNSMDSVVKDFEGLAYSDNQDYNNYIDSIKNNPMYINFKSYINNTSMDIDYYLTSDVYAVILTDSVDIVLEQQLPFEYEKQVKEQEVADNSGNEEKYKTAMNKTREVFYDAEKNGVDISYYEFGEGVSTTSKETSNPISTKPNASMYCVIEARDDGNMYYAIDIGYFDGLWGKLEPFYIKNSSDELTILTSQMLDFEMGAGFMYIHNTEFNDSMNENYEVFKRIISSDETVYVGLEGCDPAPLNEEIKKTMYDYIMMYDLITNIYKSVE